MLSCGAETPAPSCWRRSKRFRFLIRAGPSDLEGREFEQRELCERAPSVPSIRYEFLYQSDSDPHDYWLAVVFESGAAYRANVEDPEMHQVYLQFRDLLEVEPEWHDGQVVAAYRG